MLGAFLLVGHICPVNAQISSSEKEFLFAKKLYDDQLYALAADQFKDFVKKYPNNERADGALFLCGEAYFLLSEFDKAFDAYKELELSYPRSAHLSAGRFRMAQSQARLGDPEAAAGLYRSFQFYHPDDERAPLALLESGRAYVHAGKSSEALKAFFEVVRRYPDSAERMHAHIEIVTLQMAQGKYDEAIRHIDGVLRVFGSDMKDPRVYLLRGELSERTGQFDEAESYYTKLSQAGGSEQGAPEALYRLGRLYQRQGELERALGTYEKVLAAAQEPKLTAAAYIRKGDVHFLLRQFPEALQSYREAEAVNYAPLLAEARLKRARTLLASGQPDLAAQRLELFFAGTSGKEAAAALNPAQTREVYLLLVDALVQAQRPRAALAIIEEYGERFPDSAELARMQLQKARIFQQSGDDPTLALRTYDELIARFPQSDLVDDAQFGLARCYDRLGEYRLALKEYEKYLQRYPAGDAYDAVRRRKELIVETINLDEAGAAKLLSSFLTKVAGNDAQRNWPLVLGKIYFDNKDFENAVAQFKLALSQAAQPVEGQSNHELYYRLGQAYFKLAQKARLKGQPTAAQALLDSAALSLGFVREALPGEPAPEDVWLLQLQIVLARDLAAGERLAALQDTVRAWREQLPGSDQLDYALIQLARALAASDAGQPDSAAHNRILVLCDEIIRDFPGSAHLEEGYFLQASAFAALGQDSVAAADFTAFIENYPDSRFVPQALLARAGLARRKNDFEAAIADLERVLVEFYYSSLARDARSELAGIKLLTGDYQSAVNIYNDLRRTGEAGAGGRAGERDRGLLTFRLAQAYEKMQENRAALREYVRFINESPEDAAASDARLAVARIATQQGNVTFAKEYYQAILNSDAAPAFKYEAHVALGDVLFKQDAFDRARQHYLQAVALAENLEQERYPAGQAIRCQIMQRQFSAADAEIKKFKKRFKDTKGEQAQFRLDRGNAHMADKDFELAEKAFKKVRGDYKGTEFGAKAEFGLGAVYLITNHTEDALKILTGIPSKYPDSEVTPLTYFNLGDFYYKSQQVENAIFAFKKVMAHPKAGEYHPKAMWYLVQCYNDLRFWDQAAATTRAYLEKFPLDPDGFRKRIDLARFLMNLKEYTRAIARFRELLPNADADSEAEIQFYIAQSYNEMGDFARATSEYLKVKYLTRPSKLPWHVTALFEAGRCLTRLGEVAQAKKIFERIIREQGSESNFGRFARKQLDELAADIEKNGDRVN